MPFKKKRKKGNLRYPSQTRGVLLFLLAWNQQNPNNGEQIYNSWRKRLEE